MKVYAYTEARQSLAACLGQARKEGAVRIRLRDGQTFVLRPETPSGSPLDVPGISMASVDLMPIHVLRGIVKERLNVAAQVLREFGVSG